MLPPASAPVWEAGACEYSSLTTSTPLDSPHAWSAALKNEEENNQSSDEQEGLCTECRQKPFYQLLKTEIQRRGPDRTGMVERKRLANVGDAPAFTLTGLASVLGLRGLSPVGQPYIVSNAVNSSLTSDESFLMWNGEVFGGILCPNPGGSDTHSVSMRIADLEQEAFKLQNHSLTERQTIFLKLLSNALEKEIEGPYAFIYYASSLSLIAFGRDPLGRRSLLVHVKEHCAKLEKEDVVESTSLADAAREVEVIISSVGVEHRDGKLDPEGTRATAVETGRAKLSPSTQKKRSRELVDEVNTNGDAVSADTKALPTSCWVEVPVTGIMGLTLLDSCETMPSISDQEERCDLTVPKLDPKRCRVIFRHCPWSESHHLIHPLLRGPSCTTELPSSKVPPLLSLIREIEELQFPSWCSPLLLSVFQKAREAFLSSVKLNSDAREVTSRSETILVRHAALKYLMSLSASVYRRIHMSTTEAGSLCDGEGDVQLDAAGTIRKGHRPIGILFSGGLDCSVLAALAHLILPPETPIELINVAFGNEPQLAPDRIATFRAITELLRLPQDNDYRGQQQREWRLVLIDVPDKISPVHSPHILNLLTPHNSVMDLDIGTALWHAARGRGRMQRLTHSIGFPSEKMRSKKGESMTATKIGMEAQPDHEVNFEGSGVCEAVLRNHHKYYRLRRGHICDASSPTAEQKELDPESSSSSSDKFAILVQVLVTECCQSGSGPEVPVLLSTLGKDYADVLTPHFQCLGYRKLGPFLDAACREGIVRFDPNTGKSSKAIFLAREADRKIAAAAAARTRSELSDWYNFLPVGENLQEQEQFPPPDTYVMDYHCQSKVVLLGIGADETLGGYTRHRRLFLREGMTGAMRELQRDFSRLWQRNLGRDDRIVMDSGREARLPYLDESLLRTLQDLVASYKTLLSKLKSVTDENTAEGLDINESVMDENMVLQESIAPILTYKLGPGEGDKRVLRQAAELLGLSDVSRLEKRAIQFGSRIAERKVSGTATVGY